MDSEKPKKKHTPSQYKVRRCDKKLNKNALFGIDGAASKEEVKKMVAEQIEPPRAPQGRASFLTPELQEKYCNYIRQGNFKYVAAKLVRVSPETINKWLKDGRENPDSKWGVFLRAVEEAEAQNEAEIVAQWQRHTPDDWRACKDFLEKRYQQRWKHQESIQVEASVEVNRSHEISEQLLKSADARRLASDLLKSFGIGVHDASGVSDIGKQQLLEDSEPFDPTE